MKRSLSIVAWLVLGMVTGAAQAFQIVNVGTREWLQPADFGNLSWNDIASVCDSTTGACSSSALGGVASMASWTWASADDLNGLFDQFVTYPFHTPMGPGPDVSLTWESDYHDFISAGFMATVSSRDDEVVAGALRTTYDPGGMYARTGIAHLIYPDDTGLGGSAGFSTTTSWVCRSCITHLAGGWFYRESDPAEAPIPSTLPLLGLGLAALVYKRRNRKTLA